ncbi:hypothetical protein BG015_000239, partial [Linnemannia schmuckeri]
MKFLILLLLTLTIVFALPTNGVEKRADAPGCIPSTLIWTARQTETVSKGTIRQDAFTLVIRNIYVGYIAPHNAQEDVFLESRDKKWSVKHGEVAANETLTLVYSDQTFTFTEYHAKTRDAQLSKITQW